MGKKLKTNAAEAAAVAAIPTGKKATTSPAKKQQANGTADATPTADAPAATTPAAATTTTTAKPSAERNEFLKLFWNLAESDVAARTHAVAQLLANLQRKQTQQDATFQDDLHYTLKRLVRGLASSRDAARQGFSTALAGLLETFASLIAVADVQALLREAMEVHGSMKGMEQRDHMFGRLFGLLAIQRSGRLADQANQAAAVAVVAELLELAKWKKWLREACYEAVITVLADVTDVDVFVTDLVPLFAAALGSRDDDVSTLTAEQVQLAAGVHHYIHSTPGVDARVPPTFVARQFLRRNAMHALAAPLKASSVCYPRVHAAWLGVFGHVLHTGKAASQVDAELFQETWSVLVENTLLHRATATHERRGLAFKLFELVVPHLPRPLVRAILTPRLVKCLYANAVAPKNYLHAAARETLRVFAAASPDEFVHFFQKQFVAPMAALVEIDATMADDDEQNDDNDEDDGANAQATADAAAAAHRARLSGGGLDALLALEEAKERAEFVQKKHDNVRLWALDALVTHTTELLSTPPSAVDDAMEALQAQSLRFLVFHTFFIATGKAAASAPTAKKKKKRHSISNDVGLDTALIVAAPALSTTVLSTALKRVLSLLSVQLSGAETSALSRVFATTQSLLAAHDVAQLRHAIADNSDAATQLQTIAARVTDVRAAWQAAAAAPDVDAAKTQQLEAFVLLFMSSGVQLLDAAQRSDAEAVVTDLDKCYADLVVAPAGTNNATGKKAKAAKKADEAASEPSSVVVFIDMLLSLLAQDSSAMRDIVAHVFRSMLPLLTAESLATMLAVLVPNADDDDDAADDDRVTRRNGDGDDDEDEEDEEDEDEDVAMETDVVLTSAADVSNILSKEDPKVAALHREDMALAALVGHVKDRANRKKTAKRAAMHVVHFKLRVLDLLQLFAAKSATNALVLALPLPLFEALLSIQKTDKDARVLRERLHAVLGNKLLKAKDVPSGAALTPAQRAAATADLTSLVALLTTKTLDKDVAGKIGAALVVYYLRVLVSDVEDVDAAVQTAVHCAVVDTFTKRHAKFPPSVFDDLVARFPTIALHVLLTPLTAIATASTASADAASKVALPAAVDDFSKCEVFRLLSLLLKPKLLVADARAQAVVRTHVRTLQVALLALLKQQAQSDGPDLKTKRIKIVMTFALQLVKASQLVGKTPTDKASKQHLVTLMDAVIALESNSPVVKSMVKQIAEASGLPAAIAAAAAASEKKPKVVKSAEKASTADDAKTDAAASDKKTQKAKKALAAAKQSKQQKKSVPKKRKRAAAGGDDKDDEE